MPKINRIRLANFRWASQKIDHLLLDFYGGANAELCLENGGGKTVLERLIFQCVCPGAKVSSIPITDYLSEKPSLAAIEWILDGGRNEKPQHYLTGVVMCRAGTTEEDNASLRAFMFTSFDMHVLNLDNIPVLKKEGSSAWQVLDFASARRKISALAETRAEVNCYGYHDKKNYQSELSQFHISADSWDTLIRQMITGEDPFARILEDTKSSDKLMNNYIIRNIEAHLSSSAGYEPLKELMKKTVEDYADHESILKERDAVTGCRDDILESRAQLEKLQGCVETRRNALKDLCGFSLSLSSNLEETEQLLETKEKALQENEEKQERIEEEELSDAYYQAKDACSGKKELQRKAEAEKNEAEEEYLSAKKQKDILSAAYHYGIREEKAGKLHGLRVESSRKENGKDVQRVQDLKYTIYNHYNTEKVSLVSEERDLTNRKEETGKKYEEVNDLIKDLQKKEREALQKKISCENDIRHYLNAFDEMMKKTGIPFTMNRSLTGELYPDDVKHGEQYLQEEQSSLQKEKQKYMDLVKDLSKEISSLRDEQDAGNGKLLSLFMKEKELKDLLHAYRKEKESLLEQMRKYDFEEEHLNRKQELEEAVLSRLKESEQVKDRLTIRKENLEEMIRSLKQGTVYQPSVYLSKLDESGVSYVTGESYLLEQSEEERMKLLEENPLLPYTILLDERNMAKLLKIDNASFFLDRIVPVKQFGDLSNGGENHSYGETLIALQDETLIRHIDTRLLSEEGLENYRKEQNEKKDEIIKRIKEEEKECENLRTLYHAVLNFGYPAPFEKDKEEELQSVIKKKTELEARIEEIKNILPGKESEKTSAEQNSAVLDGKLRESAEKIRLFKAQMNQESDYVNMLGKLSRAEKALKKAEEEKESSQREKEKLAGEIQETVLRLQQVKSELSTVRNCLSRYDNADSRNLLHISLSQALSEYETLSSQLSRDRQEMEKSMAELQKEIDSEDEQLSRFHLEKNDYVSVTYSSLKHDEAEEKENLTRDVYERKNLAWNEAVITARTAENAVMDRLSAFRNQKNDPDAMPLERGALYGNYRERRRTLKKENEAFRKELKTLEYRVSTVSRIKDQAEDARRRNSGVMEDKSFEPLPLLERLEDQSLQILNTVSASGADVDNALEEYLRKVNEIQNRYRDSAVLKNLFAVQDPLAAKHGSSLLSSNVERALQSASQKADVLSKKADQLNADLSSLEQNKTHLINGIAGYLDQVYKGIRSVERQSRIRVENSEHKKNLLKIEMNEVSKEEGKERIRVYLEPMIQELASICRKTPTEYEKKMDSVMKTRNLLNQYMGSDTINVKVYKFDRYAEHSRLISWERACATNSGGEHSISCLIVIAALLAYMRSEGNEFAESTGRVRNEVLICDNPFASVSSEHLVKPLIAIVKTLGIQLICFTHLTAKSIADSFDVVVQLRNVKASDGLVHMKVGDVSMADDTLMEQASHYKKSEQTSLFD